MQQWAEISNGRVHHTFSTSDAFTPSPGPPLVMNITGITPRPQPGWLYDSGTATLAADPDPPAAETLGKVSGAFTAEQTSDALRLLLRRLVTR